jgi:lipooligosaccharide transport system ATP-binding protein
MSGEAVVLDARGLTKRYDGRTVVDAVSFSVTRGECVALLGPNGAGKTTTIRMLTCFTPPDAGTLEVIGLPMAPRAHRAIKRRLGIVHQEDSLDPDLSVEQNLAVYATYFGVPRAEARRLTDELIDFAALGEHRRQRIRALSGGMKRRLMLARALIGDPEMLVLDEPTTGLDPQARRLVWERIRSLKRRGTTILLTTHYMDEAERLCDRLIIMDAGRIVAEGTPAELVRRLVGAEVVEVAVAEPASAPVRARLAGEAGRVEQVGEVLYWYREDGAPEAVFAELAAWDVTRRRANLEDVFLTLTGHSLRD